MNKQEIIEALKKNEKPFGLMSQEMQEVAKEIGKSGNFEFFSEMRRWTLTNSTSCFRIGTAYRLRPDYQPEQEFVFCEIVDYDVYECPEECIRLFLCHIPSGYERVGFKFKGRKEWFSVPDGYVDKDSVFYYGATLDQIKSGERKPVHATHVVLRKVGE